MSLHTFEQRHAPKSLQDIIFADPNTRRRIVEYANNVRNGSIIFYGPYGTAKSTTAMLLAEAKAAPSTPVHPTPYHASQVNDKLLETIKNSWGLATICGVTRPAVIIDEADQMLRSIQYQLRAFIDHYKQGDVFLTTNVLDQIDKGLKDRCQVIEMPAANHHVWFDRAKAILAAENVFVSDKRIRDVLSTNDGSIRDLLKSLNDMCLWTPKIVASAP